MSVGFIRALRIAVLLVAACILVPATTVSAQTTGRIVGQISDAQGAVLPGVTVTVSSPALQGTQVQVTDAQGNYRFLSLPPGRYALKAELSSFKPAEQPNVDVGLDRTALAGVGAVHGLGGGALPAGAGGECRRI